MAAVNVLLIRHPYLPYRIKATKTEPTSSFCIVALENKYARILHIPTGLTILDCNSVQGAEIVIMKLDKRRQVSSKIDRAFKRLSWATARAFLRGHNQDPDARLVYETVMKLEHVSIVNPKVTKGLQFKSIPEYVE